MSVPATPPKPHAGARLPYARAQADTTSWQVWGIVARWLVALVLIAAAVGKIQEPLKFAEQIQAYRLVPAVVTNAMAFILPWLEVVTAGLLMIGVWRCEARRVALFMLLVFTGAKLWTEIKGLHITCGCFGGSLAWIEKSIEGWPGIVMNVVLIGLLVADAVAQRKTMASLANIRPAAQAT